MADAARVRTPETVRIAIALSIASLVLPTGMLHSLSGIDAVDAPLLLLSFIFSCWWLRLAVALRDRLSEAWQAAFETLALSSVAANLSATWLTYELFYIGHSDWRIPDPWVPVTVFGAAGSVFTLLAWRFWRQRPEVAEIAAS